MQPESFSRCAITGASGYIGGYLARSLHERGMHIIALGRTAPPEALAAQLVPFTLGQAVAPQVFEDVDILIHCAYDFQLN